jgi:hypothetical protein
MEIFIKLSLADGFFVALISCGDADYEVINSEQSSLSSKCEILIEL